MGVARRRCRTSSSAAASSRCRAGPSTRRRADHRRRQPALPRAVPHGARRASRPTSSPPLEGFSRDDVDAFAVDEPATAPPPPSHEGRFDRGSSRSTDADGERAARPRRASRARAPRSRAWPSCSPRFERWASHRRRRDSHVRRDGAATYPQVDDIDHVHHAGNSSGVVDGAAAAARRRPRLRRGPRPHAAGPHRADGGRRHRAGHHAHRARARPPSAASPRPGMTRRRHRSLGDQRGVRRRAAQDHARPRPRPRARATSTAARSRSATPSAPPARCSSAPCSTSSSAAT